MKAHLTFTDNGYRRHCKCTSRPHVALPRQAFRRSHSTVPYRAGWITGIGLFFFLLNIVLFLVNCVGISMRFYLRPGSFINSFTDQVESLFIPSFVSSSLMAFKN